MHGPVESRAALTAGARKILFLTPGCFDKGGISRYCRYQIDAVREIFGLDNVRAISLLGPDPDGFETPFEVAWHGPAPRATHASRAGFVLQVLGQAALWRPDVIHCAHVNFTPLVSRLKSLCGATTVLNVYGLELWSSSLTNSRRAHLSRMDHIIADCHATADHVVDQAMHPDVPTVIWDCADLDRFSPGPMPHHLLERYGLPDLNHHRVVLTLGRLAVAARHKGYDRLLDIWAGVSARVPNAHLVIAGRGDDADRLRAKAKDLGLTKVTFTGAIDEEDLAAIYRSAHVFALVSDKGPSRGEGIPLTPIEALASGLPVIVGNEDGSREAVDGSRNGIVVSPRDQAAMSDALVDLLTETGHARDARVTAARSVAYERFGYTKFREKHAALYAQLAGPVE